MLKKFKSLAVGAGLAIALPALASATLEGGQFYGDLENHTSPAGTFAVGDVLTIRVDLDPVQDNGLWWYPWDLGNKEYTGVINCTVSNVSLNGPFIEVDYDNATIAIYEDNVFNADCASGATFTDGTEILNGTIANMHSQLLSGLGNTNGTISFIGGAGIGNLDPDALGNVIMNDSMDPFLIVQSPCNRQIYNTDWKSPTTTAVEVNNWGRVKNLYR